MCCVSQTNIRRKKTTKRIIALAFLLCFVLVSLLSEVFIITHADHEHDHDGVGGTCSTCAQIQSAENLLKKLGTASLIVASAIFGLFSVFTGKQAFSDITTPLTPVMLKIRMNN